MLKFDSTDIKNPKLYTFLITKCHDWCTWNWLYIILSVIFAIALKALYSLYSSIYRKTPLITNSSLIASWAGNMMIKPVYLEGNIPRIKVAQNSFQHLDFDGLLWLLFITWCYKHGIETLPNYWWTRCHPFHNIIGYHSNSITCLKYP